MAAQPRTNYRYVILASIFFNVVINYMDRTNISVAAPMISKDLNLRPDQMGLIFSAFGWTYAALQIPGGILADRFGPRIIYSFALVLWSIATMLQSLATGFASLFGFRLAIGVFEAPSYPTNNRIVTSWFPNKERASAIAIYTSGQFLGLAFLAPVLTSIQYYTGWKGLFMISGGIGIIWGIIWYFFYRDPIDHKKVSKEELDYIEEGGGLIDRKQSVSTIKKEPFTWKNLKEVFSHRKLWGIYLGQFCLGASMWFFLTWFPTYLVTYRGFDFIKSGYISSIPFIAAFIGILTGGFLSDKMIKDGRSVSFARKAPVITGLLLTTAIIGANYVDSKALVILFMCIAFFGNGLASITWVFVSALAPKHLIGLTGGVFNFIGGLSAVFIPLIIGVILKGGSFAPALALISLLGVAGACCYIFLVGKVERVETGNTL